ncbi:MAG: hypothetical protein ACYTBJ_01695 [Planctomycetota bacterium]
MAKRKPSLKKLQAEVDRFNEECPVGTAVTVTKDLGDVVHTKVRFPAEVLSGHTAVGWFEDIRGCYLLSRAAKA